MYKVKAQVLKVGEIETIVSSSENFQNQPKREVIISQGPDFPRSTFVFYLYNDKATDCRLIEGEWYLFDLWFKIIEPKKPTWTDKDGIEHPCLITIQTRMLNYQHIEPSTPYELLKQYD